MGFGFSIRNIYSEEKAFYYSIKAVDVYNNVMGMNEADNLIALGDKGSTIRPPGSVMDDPEFVRFDIPETVPPAKIRYEIRIREGSTSGQIYSSVTVDLEILSE